MEPYPIDFSEAGAREVIKTYTSKLIKYLTKEKNLVSQEQIAIDTGYSKSTISRLFTGKLISSNDDLDIYFFKILKKYEVECDLSSVAFSGGALPKREVAQSMNDQCFVGGAEGNHWRIMVEIWDRRNSDRKVGIRYLKIDNFKDKVSFRVGIKNQFDYTGGKGEFMFSGHQLRFVFPAIDGRQKMVYLRFIIGSKLSQPTLMSGIMVHNHLDIHTNSGYIIFAENISHDTRKFVPEKMDFEKFKLMRPEIARFFELHNTFIHCPREIYNVNNLRKNNAKRERENEEIEAGRKAEANQPKKTLEDFEPLRFKEEGDPDDLDD